MKIFKKFKSSNLIFFLFLFLYSTNLYAELTRNFITVIRPGTTGFINADGNKSIRDALQDPFGFYISPDGKTVFNSNNATSHTNCITQLELQIPFELSSAILVDESNILNTVALRSGGRDDCRDVYVSPDGKHMSVTNEQGAIYDFNLPTPFSLRGATIKAGYLNPFVNAPIRGDDVYFNNDGSKMFVIDVAGDNLKEYTTVLPFTSNGVTLINTVDLTSETVIDGTETAHDFFFNDTGQTLIILVNDHGTDEHDDTIFQFSLRVPFDTTTLTLVGSSVISGYDGTENNSDALAIAFGNDGTKLYIMNKDGGPLLGTRTDTLSQFNLPCSYGIVQCVSNTASSIESQVELVKQNISLNVDTMFKRFEWIKRNRDDENLSAHNFNINYHDPLIQALANKFEPSAKKNIASVISKHKPKDKKSKWSSWSLADISLRIFGSNDGIIKPKDINTSGLTIGADRKFGDNKFFGLALRYSDGSSDIKRSQQHLNMESLTLNLYGVSPSKDNQYINAVLGLSILRFDHQNMGHLSGKRKGKQAFASINYRIKDKYGIVNVTPTGKFTYGVTSLSEFTDFLSLATGLSSEDVIYKEDTFVNGEFAGGFLFETDIIETNNGTIQPMGAIEILYDLTSDIDYKYVLQGKTHVNKNSILKHVRQTLKTSLGFEAIYLNGFTVSADYQTTIPFRDRVKNEGLKFRSETFIIKFSHSKEDDNQFALNYDPINAHQTNLSYSKNVHGLDFKINSNQSLENGSEYFTNLEVSGKF